MPMRFEDEERPRSEMANNAALQISGSPLPAITLMFPMEGEIAPVWHCVCGKSSPLEEPGCEDRCERVSRWKWGWLACIHAHVEGSTFSYHTGWISSLEEFSKAYMEDPEGALLRYFKYEGPKPKRPPTQVLRVIGMTEEDVFSCAGGS
jgi:hypothetical protein